MSCPTIGLKLRRPPAGWSRTAQRRRRSRSVSPIGRCRVISDVGRRPHWGIAFVKRHPRCRLCSRGRPMPPRAPPASRSRRRSARRRRRPSPPAAGVPPGFAARSVVALRRSGNPAYRSPAPSATSRIASSRPAHRAARGRPERRLLVREARRAAARLPDVPDDDPGRQPLAADEDVDVQPRVVVALRRAEGHLSHCRPSPAACRRRLRGPTRPCARSRPRPTGRRGW